MEITTIAENEISQQAKQGLPLILPWGRQAIRLGTTYHSRLQGTTNPWSDETPFVLSDMHMIPKELHAEYGTTSTFKKVKTTRESETGDHLSLGFGIGVGLPFLASVSVKGTFDQHIQENKDSDKISVNATCRAGTIEFQRQPRLTKEAIIEIKYGGGYEGLCDRYGDYYVSGYRLGGDTGILMSASGHSREQIDKYGVTATVEVLFVEVSKHWEKDFRTFSAGRQVRLLGYDTLDAKTWNRFRAAGDDVKEMVAWAAKAPLREPSQNEKTNLKSLLGKAMEEEKEIDVLRGETGEDSVDADTHAIMTRSESLLERIYEVLDRHGYENGQSLTFVQCEELLAEGIVIELLLEPMRRLRDVIHRRSEKNII
ncbi:hypothetical protein GGR57DRAFT_244945 [Xylariaceae sp. FL1272]|nr:hypothetical protein GGR57DRAFT_244945 [Xylariaceae sp. FL1272]